MPLAVIVDWYGPYHNFDAFKNELSFWENGTRTLYMAVGPYNVVKYVGLTEAPSSRPNNHKLRDYPDLNFYVGEVVTQGISGRKLTRHKPDLAAAEHALIWWLQPEYNIQKKQTAPQDCVSVFSRFFDVDGEKPVALLPKFPRLVGWNSWTGEFE
jgi:hypothetical protein